MATARAFPSIKPTSRSYTPGNYPSTNFESLDGTKTHIRYGNKRVNATLSLGFSNITDADAALILANYEDVNSDWDYVTFASASGTAGVGSTSLSNYFKEDGSGLKWRYSGPPSVTSTFKGMSNVSCSFVACLDAPQNKHNVLIFQVVAFYSGKDGQLFIDGDKAAKVQSWSFSSSQAVLETTSLEDTDRTIVQGVRSYSGSARLFYYQASAGAGGDVTDLIDKCIKAGSGAGDGTAAASTAATLKLKIVDGSANGRFITFSTLITGISMNSAVGEVLSADISWESNGAPTEVSI